MKALRFERKTDFSFYVCHLSKDTKDTFCIIIKMELQLDDSLANRLNTFLKVTGNYEVFSGSEGIPSLILTAEKYKKPQTNHSKMDSYIT